MLSCSARVRFRTEILVAPTGIESVPGHLCDFAGVGFTWIRKAIQSVEGGSR